MERRILALVGNRQLQLLAGLLVALLIVLGISYFLFLRTEYSILFRDLRPAEASAIVAELDRQHAPYELRDDGAAIAVPADQAPAIRVSLAGSDLSARGMVGFELFNESDMGLTDFAQRVNYQRALQGELARTIMMMDGIEHARVHLALPERSLFRASRSEPRAAITIIPRQGVILDDLRVAGIQRLVSAAVPALSLSDVVVLNEAGRTISSSAAPEALMSPEAEEHSAVELYFRARARAAIERALPGLHFQLRVLALPRSSAGSGMGAVGAGPGSGEYMPSSAPEARDFKLRILFFTESELGVADQAHVRDIVAEAVDLDESTGDSLTIGVAPIAATIQPDPVAAVATPSGAGPAEKSGSGSRQDWLLLLAAAIGGAGIIAILRARSSKEERKRFVQRIREALGPAQEAQDAGT